MIERARIDGNPSDPRHGTVNGYGNLKCRCDRCRETWAVHNRHLRIERAASLAPDDPRHGTISTYQNYMCRCYDCTKTASAARKRYREK